jgi:hypothetical protein
LLSLLCEILRQIIIAIYCGVGRLQKYFLYAQMSIQCVECAFTVIYTIWIKHSLQASITCTNSSFGFFSSLFLINFLCSPIRLTQLIPLQKRFLGPRYIGDDIFLWPRYIGDDFFVGAKQEGLAIVHFLNKLIVSCKETVRVPF